MDARDTLGILHGEASDSTASVAAHGMYRLQVGLDAGATPGIGSGNRIHDGRYRSILFSADRIGRERSGR